MYWKTKYADHGMRLRKTQLIFCWRKWKVAYLVLLSPGMLVGGPAHESYSWMVLNPDLCTVIARAILWTAWKLMTLCLQKAFLNSSILDSTSDLCFSVEKHFFSSFFSSETPFQVSNLIFWSWLRHQARESGFYSQAYANTRIPMHPGLFCYKASKGHPKL